MSKIIESLRGDLAALHEAGAIGKVTMREFDAICPPPGSTQPFPITANYSKWFCDWDCNNRVCKGTT